MAGQSNAAPVIIKRKKVIQGGGHHGGAWKVAYADFVTAMMAFFLLMWLLNATTEKQRKGISDYFNPTIPVNRISGGGDGAFGGNSVFSEETMAHTGTGATDSKSAAAAAATEDGNSGNGKAQSDLEDVEKALLARGGESSTMERLLRHVITRVTDEGLVIEVFDVAEAPLFAGETPTAEPVAVAIAALLSEVLNLTTNEIAVNGHVRAYPVTLIVNPVWDLSAARAQAMRTLLEGAGIDGARVQRVSGFADRKPATTDPAMIRNNRLEIILLRRDR
jgi:chemotaxis protein MotB